MRMLLPIACEPGRAESKSYTTEKPEDRAHTTCPVSCGPAPCLCYLGNRYNAEDCRAERSRQTEQAKQIHDQTDERNSWTDVWLWLVTPDGLKGSQIHDDE